MKTCKNLLSGLFSALLLTGVLTSCQEKDIPSANTRLSYPAGEMALGNPSYTSALPSLRTNSTPEFAVTAVKHNGTSADASLAAINPQTGIITMTIPTDESAVGEYLVSVSLTGNQGVSQYPDVFKLMVKGILYEQSVATTSRGTARTIPVKENYLVQGEGTVYRLIAPEANTQDYTHFSVDAASGAVTVDAEAEAGIYPISIEVTNRTNPEGFVIGNALEVIVESKPYGLTYTPASISLIPKEGHISPRPSIRAASEKDGASVTFALLDDYSGTFSIDASTGEISLAEDTDLVTTLAKTYKLQVRTTNDKGSTSFPDIYTVTVDPNKKADPITAIAYTDTFPVKLKPGEAWTSSRPTITGSTVGIQFSLTNAPSGISINPKSGIVTMAAGHHMPLLTTDNKLTVEVINQGMSSAYTTDFAFSIDPILWKVSIGSNTADNCLTNSGINNMDRYSFLGEMFKSSPTGTQVKLGWSKSSAGNLIDFLGVNTAQNNDWLVSSQISLDSYDFSKTIAFSMSFAYGTAQQNLLEAYILDDTQNIYTTGAQEEAGTLASQPGSLNWIKLQDIVPTTTSNAATFGNYTLPIPASYNGMKIRFAIRYYNPDDPDNGTKNNTRTYKLQDNLRVEVAIPAN